MIVSNNYSATLVETIKNTKLIKTLPNSDSSHSITSFIVPNKSKEKNSKYKNNRNKNINKKLILDSDDHTKDVIIKTRNNKSSSDNSEKDNKKIKAADVPSASDFYHRRRINKGKIK